MTTHDADHRDCAVGLLRDGVLLVFAAPGQLAGPSIRIIEGIKRAGITSVRAITEELNRQGINAPRGGAWPPTGRGDPECEVQQFVIRIAVQFDG